MHSRSGKKCLNFLHIPKTAGTSIEMTAIKSRRHPSDPLWGAFNHSIKCERPLTCPGGLRRKPTCCYMGNGSALKKGSSYCSAWHVPPSEDKETARSYANGCDTFCVVRHPASRAVSEFMHGLGKCDVGGFAQWLRGSAAPGLDPYRRDCHLVPQIRYVFSADHAQQYCQHILRYDNLEAEFNALMQSFDIPLKLTPNKYLARPCHINFTQEIHGLIAAAYKDDFDEKAFHFDRDLMHAVFEF